VRRFAPLLLLLVILAACAPAAGRPAIPYRATSSEIIGAIAQFGPQIQPGRSYNYFSIETISNDAVTLYAEETTANRIIGAIAGTASSTVRVTVTTFQAPGSTSVAISTSPAGNDDLYELFVRELDRRFERAPVGFLL